MSVITGSIGQACMLISFGWNIYHLRIRGKSINWCVVHLGISILASNLLNLIQFFLLDGYNILCYIISFSQLLCNLSVVMWMSLIQVDDYNKMHPDTAFGCLTSKSLVPWIILMTYCGAVLTLDILPLVPSIIKPGFLRGCWFSAILPASLFMGIPLLLSCALWIAFFTSNIKNQPKTKNTNLKLTSDWVLFLMAYSAAVTLTIASKYSPDILIHVFYFLKTGEAILFVVSNMSVRQFV